MLRGGTVRASPQRMKTLSFVLSAGVLVLGASCGGDDANVPEPSDHPKVSEGFYATNDSSFPYPLVAVKMKAGAPWAYSVHQFSCKDAGGSQSFTSGGIRDFSMRDNIGPYIGGPVALVWVTSPDNRCKIMGRIYPGTSSDNAIVKAFDATYPNYPLPEIATATLSMVTQDQFATQFASYGLHPRSSSAQPAQAAKETANKETFCQDLFGGKSCTEVLQ
jgi:hypothetical protein